MRGLFQAVKSAYSCGVPFKATVAVTWACPCRCAHCGIFKKKEKELSVKDLLAALSSLQSIAWLDLTGGEVLVRPDIIELSTALVSALKHLAWFHFPTSGLFPETAELLARTVAKSGVRVVVSVSIDGPEALHDRLRGVPGAFSAAVETLSRLKRLKGVDTYVGATILPENVEEIPLGLLRALRERVPSLASSVLHVNLMQRSGPYFNNSEAALPDVAAVRRGLARVIAWRGIPLSSFGLLDSAFQIISLSRLALWSWLTPRCAALDASFFLSPSGIVYPCHMWSEPVGTVGPDVDVAQLLRSDRARWIRKSIAAGHCPRCWTPCEAYPTMIVSALNPLRIKLTGKTFRRSQARP